MSLQFRQLFFLRKHLALSRRSISRATGIPTSTLFRVEKQQAILPTKYNLSLRRVYQRQAYKILRDEGMSVSQSNRFKWLTPETIMIKRGSIQTVVQFLTEGAFVAKKVSLDKQGISYRDLELYEEMNQKVKDGLRKSKKELEEWEEY